MPVCSEPSYREYIYSTYTRVFFNLSNEPNLGRIHFAGQYLEEVPEVPETHVMLEPVWSGTALAGFLQLPGHGGHVRHHHLVHKAAETQPAKQRRTVKSGNNSVIGYQVRHGQRKTFAEATPLYCNDVNVLYKILKIGSYL